MSFGGGGGGGGGLGRAFVPYRMTSGSERYHDAHVVSDSSVPLFEKTRRVTLVRRDGSPPSSMTWVPVYIAGSETRLLPGGPVTKVTVNADDPTKVRSSNHLPVSLRNLRSMSG